MTSSADRRAVLFDIDGTLVDSNYLHVEAWGRAFAELGVPVEAYRIHRCIGMGADVLLAELLPDTAELVGDDAKELHARFYGELSDRLRRFDGVQELLAGLAARGVCVVLATSAPDDELKVLRDVLQVDDSLHAATSSDDVEQAKPHPDLVEAALEKAGASPANAIMVGDTVWDVRAARRAGVDCVAVLTGGISEAELRDAGAVAVFQDVAELARSVAESPLARLLDGETHGEFSQV